jgi:hypothetical protein
MAAAAPPCRPSLPIRPLANTAGTGEIIFDGPTSNNRVGQIFNSTFSYPSTLTIRTGSQGGSLTGNQITINGTVAAITSGKTIAISPTRFTLGNSGLLKASSGGTITIGSTTTLTNLSNGILTGGNWQVYAGSNITIPGAAITTNAANVLLSGPDAIFDALLGLRSNTGIFSITDGRRFNATDAFSNSGLLSIGPGSVFANDFSFNEVSGSNLKFILCGTVPNQDFGTLTGLGSASLAGRLSVEFCPGYMPSEGDAFAIINRSSISGSFDDYSFPPMGDLHFEIQSDSTSVTLRATAAPEPCGAAVILAMGVAIRAPRRRRLRTKT